MANDNRDHSSPVDARLSTDGQHVVCGRCQERLASLIHPSDADYLPAVRLFGADYPLFRLSGYLPKDKGIFRLSARAQQRHTSRHRRPFAEGGIAGTAANHIIGWGHPAYGTSLIACPRNGRCGRINIIDRDHWEAGPADMPPVEYPDRA
jgi:hypothetical protein